jgi:hypothetical protein
LDSIDELSGAVSALPEPLPPNYPKNIEGKAGMPSALKLRPRASMPR